MREAPSLAVYLSELSDNQVRELFGAVDAERMKAINTFMRYIRLLGTEALQRLNPEQQEAHQESRASASAIIRKTSEYQNQLIRAIAFNRPELSNELLAKMNGMEAGSHIQATF